MSRAVTTDRVRSAYAATPVQKGALIYGIVFLLVGLGGFIPGLTSHYDALSGAGDGSMAMLIGLFQVSVLHNIVHLLYGIVGLLAARAAAASRAFLLIGGIVYAVLWVYGLFVGDSDTAANFVPLNTADNWLHLALAVTMIALSFLLPGARRRTAVARG